MSCGGTRGQSQSQYAEVNFLTWVEAAQAVRIGTANAERTPAEHGKPKLSATPIFARQGDNKRN